MLRQFLFGRNKPEVRTFDPTTMDLDLVLVLVDERSAATTQQTISSVASTALSHGGDVMQILGPLIFISFGAATPEAKSAELRTALVKQLAETHRVLIRIIHGRLNAHCGIFGCTDSQAFTAVPRNFPSLLAKLTGLQPGETYEERASYPSVAAKPI